MSVRLKGSGSMGFLDKAKSAAGTATTKAKEGLEEVQTKRELGQAYDELGKLVFELAEAGEIIDARLDDTVARIRKLRSELEAG
jgi:hypothetical protein